MGRAILGSPAPLSVRGPRPPEPRRRRPSDRRRLYLMEPPFVVGSRVRLSEAGREKVRAMPEAWGLHRALYQEEAGEVVDYFPSEGGSPAQMSVEFPSGGAYNWEAACFELLPD